MYNPQQNQPLYTRPVQNESGFPWRLLLLTGVLFVLAVLVYAGISFGYNPYLKGQISDIDKKLDEVTSSLQAKESDIFEVYSQLYNISTLSSKHVYGSKLFTLLESGTLPSVKIVKLDLNVLKNSIALEGIAPSHDIVVTQVTTYMGTTGVENAKLESSAQDENGGIAYKITLDVDKSFFNEQ